MGAAMGWDGISEPLTADSGCSISQADSLGLALTVRVCSGLQVWPSVSGA
jgi:hypothetical protein